MAGRVYVSRGFALTRVVLGLVVVASAGAAVTTWLRAEPDETSRLVFRVGAGAVLAVSLAFALAFVRALRLRTVEGVLEDAEFRPREVVGRHRRSARVLLRIDGATYVVSMAEDFVPRPEAGAIVRLRVVWNDAVHSVEW